MNEPVKTEHAVFGESALGEEETRRVAAAVAGEDPDAWENEEDQEIPAELQADLDSGTASVLFWRALIMPVRPRKRSKGGLILVAESQENAQYLTYIGKLVALGPLWCKGSSFEQYETGALPELKPGDWVIYGRHAGQRIEFKGVKLLLMNDDEKLMKIRSPDGWRIYG